MIKEGKSTALGRSKVVIVQEGSEAMFYPLTLFLQLRVVRQRKKMREEDFKSSRAVLMHHVQVTKDDCR